MRQKHDRDTVIDAFMEVVPDVIHGIGFGAACIAATRVGIDVLRYFGVNAKAAPIKLAAFNQSMVDHMNASPNADPGPQESWPADAWSVAVGHGGEGKGWNGHLVINIDGERVIDLTVGQMSRPDRGLPLPPATLAHVNAEFWTGTRAATITDDGVWMVIEYDGRNRTYTSAPDWRIRSAIHQRVVAGLIRTVRERLEAPEAVEPPATDAVEATGTGPA